MIMMLTVVFYSMYLYMYCILHRNDMRSENDFWTDLAWRATLQVLGNYV